MRNIIFCIYVFLFCIAAYADVIYQIADKDEGKIISIEKDDAGEVWISVIIEGVITDKMKFHHKIMPIYEDGMELPYVYDDLDADGEKELIINFALESNLITKRSACYILDIDNKTLKRIHICYPSANMACYDKLISFYEYIEYGKESKSIRFVGNIYPCFINNKDMSYQCADVLKLRYQDIYGVMVVDNRQYIIYEKIEDILKIMISKKLQSE